MFEECPQIDAIDEVERLIGLRFLGVSECGAIASLSPVRGLTQLETFYAWGSTRILDGDLSPLTQLPRLQEIRMRNRRGYKPPVPSTAGSALPSLLNSRLGQWVLDSTCGRERRVEAGSRECRRGRRACELQYVAQVTG